MVWPRPAKNLAGLFINSSSGDRLLPETMRRASRAADLRLNSTINRALRQMSCALTLLANNNCSMA